MDYKKTNAPATTVTRDMMELLSLIHIYIVMEIPRHLERDWMNGRDAHVLVAANSVNGTKGGLGSSYLTAIINGCLLYTSLS